MRESYDASERRGLYYCSQNRRHASSRAVKSIKLRHECR